jgi:hypothetical protein
MIPSWPRYIVERSLQDGEAIHMKASQLLAIGVIAFSVSFVAAATPAVSPASVHKKKLSSYEQRPALPCLIGTERCSAKNDPPVKACLLGAHNDESCSTDGVKNIDVFVH